MKWALKIGLKSLLARLPIPYSLWRSFGVFRHGKMDSVEYALKIFNLHTQHAYSGELPSDSVIMELGPGDSIISAILGCAYGAKKIYLIDAGDFATKDIFFYKSFSESLSAKGIAAPDLSSITTFEGVLSICNAEYLTNGLASLRKIPSESIDFIWSHSVLEHVRKNEFCTVLTEFKRILKTGSLSSHNIDYQDHLDSSLNNLRFSEKLWESSFFVKSGFYTNRIPAIAMHEMFRKGEFEIVEEAFGKWPVLPVPRSAMHSDFQHYKDDELINRTSRVLLKSSKH
jgi:hypothetical protein